MDALFADCVANPDDDGPRLVWADSVGGERGELVVIQCDLARGGLTVEERQRRKVRERELLEKHAVTWAGELAPRVDQWCFRRGFIEAVRLSDTVMEAEDLPVLAPLVRTITVKASRIHRLLDLPTPKALDGLLGLGVVGHTNVEITTIELILSRRQLRAFGLDGFRSEHVGRWCKLLGTQPIETLHLTNARLSADELEHLLSSVPKLSSLVIDPGWGHRLELDVVARRSLRALRLGNTTPAELASLAGTPLAKTLERLGFGVIDTPVRPALPALQQYEPFEDPREHHELLHHDPRALLNLGRSWYRHSPPFVLVRLDEPAVFEVPAIPVFDWTTIGRSFTSGVQIESGSLARNHARIGWSVDHHVVAEVDSHTFVNDVRVHQQTELRDGDEIRVGEARLRYLIGHDALQRARA